MTKQPNILFAISDDQSWPHASAYGCRFVETPAFDRLAREGVLFENAFTNCPSCAPARAAILTGLHMWRLEEASNLQARFPAKFSTYPDILKAHGYHVGFTGKGWAPGSWEAGGRTRNPAGNEYNVKELVPPISHIARHDYFANFIEFLQARKEGQPFCFWYGGREPHRIYEYGSGLRAGKDINSVTVPDFLPDTEEVRTDLLDYALQIEWYDSHLGRMLEYLDEIGEADNTLVISTSDNGMPFPRVKANLYPQSCNVPFVLRWSDRITGGRVATDFISLADLAPTFLEAAGITSGINFSVKSLMPILDCDRAGRIDESRSIVFNGRERHAACRNDFVGYPMRSCQNDRYLYVKNYENDRWPAGDPVTTFGDCDGSPTKRYILEHRDYEFVQPKYRLAFEKRPREELYDLSTDYACLHNLAYEEEFQTIKKEMKNQLEAKLVEEEDPRELGFGEIFDAYPYENPKPKDYYAYLSGFTELRTYNTELYEQARRKHKQWRKSKNDEYDD